MLAVLPLGRYDAAVGVVSLENRSSRPQRSPQRTPPEIEAAICALKQAHTAWGRRQIAKQLRWQWRDEPERQRWVSVGRVRRVLAQHPELGPPAATLEHTPPRHIDYLTCNLLWAADIHETHLADGSVWYTLHWLDLYSRFELGQLTTQHVTEELVVHSFLDVAQQHGLPQIVKTDHDKLWYDGVSGLPTHLTRVLCALGVYHLLVGPNSPGGTVSSNAMCARVSRKSSCHQRRTAPPCPRPSKQPATSITSNAVTASARISPQSPSINRVYAAYLPISILRKHLSRRNPSCYPAKCKPVAASLWRAAPSRSASTMRIRPLP